MNTIVLSLTDAEVFVLSEAMRMASDSNQVVRAFHEKHANHGAANRDAALDLCEARAVALGTLSAKVTAAVLVEPEPVKPVEPTHTVRGGKPAATFGDYGVQHDFDCPACLASGTSYTASPRSETYWSS